MYGNSHGRFTSPDPYNIIFEKEKGRNNAAKRKILRRFIVEPQIWNRYVYVLNNPLKFVDPLGLIYLRVGDAIRYYDDEYYNDNKDKIREEFGEYKIVPEGTIFSVGEGSTGMWEPYIGKKVVLGANGNLLEITNHDIELGTVRTDYDPSTPPMVATNTDRNLSTYANSIHDTSWAAHNRFAPLGDPNGRGEYYNGGLRHCVGSCLLIRKYDSFGYAARKFWDLKNETFQNYPDSGSDMQAEDIGDFLSDANGSCEILCSNAYPPRPR